MTASDKVELELAEDRIEAVQTEHAKRTLLKAFVRRSAVMNLERLFDEVFDSESFQRMMAAACGEDAPEKAAFLAELESHIYAAVDATFPK